MWPVEVHLQRWKLTSTEICKFCNNVDNTFHVFAQCKVVNDFLTKLFSYIDPNNIFSHDNNRVYFWKSKRCFKPYIFNLKILYRKLKT